MTQEETRLNESRDRAIPWKKWGPYLSERQWGTVREDYSDDGNAWAYFNHDQSRSRAYHWGEDGLAGFSDDKQRLCFALALWNEHDPILKERLFGLANSEGNHGEDVKEYYFYLDSTPTHSYMKYLYKYPQVPFPYLDLVQTNRQRGGKDLEYELLDTGVFNDNRYFDVFVEYAKQSPEEILIRITAHNRGPEAHRLHILPTLWFRNTWTWWPGTTKPALKQTTGPDGTTTIAASGPIVGNRYLYCQGDVPLLFTENETNAQRLFGQPNPSPYVKDGINDCVVQGKAAAVNPLKTGTKASAHYAVDIPAGGSFTVRLRLTNAGPEAGNPFGEAFDRLFEQRQREADEFYHAITPPEVSEDAARVMRQALAGMMWTKQHYFFDLDKWLEEHGAHPLHPLARQVRNQQWFHMVNDDVISMPDKWEYPWYAAWDLAFHTIAIAMVDLDLAKQQLELMLQEAYIHPSGQVPAYEWNFGDVNPPVHALAALMLYEQEQATRGQGDVEFLKRIFTKLVLNFTWWVNRKDRAGRNVFEGGFLGLDNIGVFDRSAPLPTGGYIEQADGTAWMAMYCQNMLEIAVELASHDRTYEPMALKFTEHFLWIASAMNQLGPTQDGLWDEQDGFYYDVLRLPDESAQRLKVRSIVGLLPLAATTIIEKRQREKVPQVVERVISRLKKMPQLLSFIHPTGPGYQGVNQRGILALVNPDRLRRILSRMLDENEFLGPHGLRALSRYHLDHPYVFNADGKEYRVQYLPAESDSGMFGGNSNWRGPVWMPVNLLLIRALRQFYLYHGDNFKVECPTGSGHMMNLCQVGNELASRLTRIFLRDPSGRRPVYGGAEKFQTDPHWRDLILFYEYFHGDNGAGLGASHQTGWTGTVARMIQILGYASDEEFLKEGRSASIAYRARKETERPGEVSGKQPSREKSQPESRPARTPQPKAEKPG